MKARAAQCEGRGGRNLVLLEVLEEEVRMRRLRLFLRGKSRLSRRRCVWRAILPRLRFRVARSFLRSLISLSFQREIFPFPPSVEVDKCLHTPPFPNLSLKPWKTHWLR